VLELDASKAGLAEWQVVVLGERVLASAWSWTGCWANGIWLCDPSTRALGKVQGCQRLAVLADGSPVLVVDVEDLSRHDREVTRRGSAAPHRRADSGRRAANASASWWWTIR